MMPMPPKKHDPALAKMFLDEMRKFSRAGYADKFKPKPAPGPEKSEPKFEIVLLDAPEEGESDPEMPDTMKEGEGMEAMHKGEEMMAPEKPESPEGGADEADLELLRKLLAARGE